MTEEEKLKIIYKYEEEFKDNPEKLKGFYLGVLGSTNDPDIRDYVEPRYKHRTLKPFTYSDNDNLINLLYHAYYYFLDLDTPKKLTEKQLRAMLNHIENLAPILEKLKR